MNISPVQSPATSVTDAATASRRSQPLTPSALRNASPEVQRAEVAAQFEAILVRQLLAPTMTSMVGSEGTASSVYGDLLTDTLAQQLTRGGGLGLGRLLEQQLTPRAPSTLKTS